MQASLARWAVVTFWVLGAVGCQSTKPSWWPGQKAPVYSQSSTTPPAAVQQQYQQQQQQYQQSGQQYPQQAPGYMDAASQGTPNSYQTGAGGYPIGNANPVDPYGMAGSQATHGANPYDHGYAGQQQQPTGGAYPEQFAPGATPNGQYGAGGYADPQGATGYPSAQGYQQAGASPYGAAGAAGGYDSVRAADQRYQAGGASTGAPGYGTNSPYDANTQGQYNQPAAQGSYQQTAPQTEQAYQPGTTGYQPGTTGYAPPGTAPYQPPTGAYATDVAGAGQADAPYRPGSTKDYLPATGGAATTAGLGQPATTTATAGSGSRYPSTTAGATGYPTPNSGPALDRYGRPIQEAAGGYATDPTIQR